MKRLLQFFLSLFGISLLAGYTLSGVKAQEVFDPMAFRIDVTHMIPQAYPSRTLSYGYFLKVHHDSVQVSLPYMGRVYQPEMNDEGLQFDLPYEHLKIEDGRKESKQVCFTVKKSFIQYRFQITVWPNGRADIFLSPSNAQAVSYDGDLIGTGK